jgi:hypothetical protein
MKRSPSQQLGSFDLKMADLREVAYVFFFNNHEDDGIRAHQNTREHFRKVDYQRFELGGAKRFEPSRNVAPVQVPRVVQLLRCGRLEFGWSRLPGPWPEPAWMVARGREQFELTFMVPGHDCNDSSRAAAITHPAVCPVPALLL